MLGLLLGCGLRRSEVVGLRLDQLQLRESHWAIVDLEGKGGRIRTVPVPNWCKGLVDVWLRHSGVNDGKVFRRVLKNGARQDAGVTANVVWYAVKRCAKQAGIGNLAPVAGELLFRPWFLRVPRPSAASPFHSERAGMEGRRAMSDPHDRIRRDVVFCKEVAERIGLGFELPSKNAVVGPNGPTIKSEPVWRWRSV
jgi:hypothetical protein